MNKVRINNKEQRIFFAFLISIISFFILIGCDNPIASDSNVQVPLPEGKGSFSLTFADTARTILPTTPSLSDFAVYSLIFTHIGGTVESFDRTNETIATKPVFLEPGIYSLVVYAYKDNEKNQLTAQGTADNITITTGNNTQASITLKALLSGGTGTFRWSISIPSDVSSARMTITPGNDSGTNQQAINLAPPTSAGDCTLNSGSYGLTFHLEKADGKLVEWKELLYVYRSMESVYNHTFTNAHFSDTRYTVTYKYNDDGLTADGTQSVLHGDTLSMPTAPGRSGYAFGGWYSDSGLLSPYTFSTPITGNIILFAKWLIINVSSVSLFPPTVTLGFGESKILTANITPANATNKNLVWASDNTAVAEVDTHGTVTAKAPGITTVYVSTVDGGKIASCVVTVNASVNPVSKYVADGYSLSDKIKYSVSYEGYDFYYIYLGQMKNIPLYSYSAYYHNGENSTYTITVTESMKESLQRTVTENRQTALGMVDTYTTSSTMGGKVSVAISEKYTVNTKLKAPGAELGFGAELGINVSVEDYWSKVATGSTSGSTQLTTSLTDTTTHGTEYTKTTMESRTWPFENCQIGFYRYSLFSTSAVYLYVIRDPNNPNEIYYEFREHVVPDVYFWMMDFSENPAFEKIDASRFGFDVSMLENLPKPSSGYSTVIFDRNNSDAGSTDANPQFMSIYASPGYLGTLPTAPKRDNWIFDGWNTAADGNGTAFTQNTPVTANTIVYAKWVPIPTHTVTYNLNGGSGAIPAAQTVFNGISVTLPDNSGISRSSYIFGGWNENVSVTGINYTAGSSYIPTANITLYAKWNYAPADGSEEHPYPLEKDTWTDGNIISTASGSAVWYSFNVDSGKDYYIWWNDSQGDSGKNLDVLVSAFYNNGMSIFIDEDTAWAVVYKLTATTTGTVNLKIFPKNSGGTGSFAVVFSDSYGRPIAPAGIEQNPFPLSPNIWSNGNITTTVNGSSVWYLFNVVEGTTYHVWWNDSLDGDATRTDNKKTLDILVNATYSNGTTIFNLTDNGYNTPRSFTASTTDIVKIKVTPKNSGNTGSFGIAYNTIGESANARPSVPVTLFSKEENNIWVQENNHKYWDIETPFDIDRLRSEGYIKFTISFSYYADRYAGLGRLWTTVCMGHRSNLVGLISHEQNGDGWVRLNTSISFIQYDIDNKLTIDWGVVTSAYTIGAPTITIEAIK